MACEFVGKLRTTTCQVECFQKALATPQRGGLISLPCGYGKTTVSLAIAAKIGLRTMVIVHKEFLATQWEERIRQFCPGATIGRVQQDKVETDADFVIAMLQSLSSKEYAADAFDKIGCLIVDECHHICAKVFSQSLFKLGGVRWTFGLSATPHRKDGLSKVMLHFLGDIFFAVEQKREGVEVFPIVFETDMFSGPPPTTRNGKLSLVSMITELVEHRERNAMLVKLIKKISPGRHVLVLSDRRLHCEMLHQCFPKTSGLYMGGMKPEQLEESSKKPIIFATFSQAHEGLDISSLDTVVLCTPKSDIVQSIGRCMRETPGKVNNPRIYDIHDKWSILSAMFYKRMKVYRQGNFVVHGGGGAEEAAGAADVPRGTCLIKI